ncbi:SWI/SNF-related matrix-associated actin-dependent regulator of chromatin subfamily D [Nematocida sp. AWRm80]|nr:SWI/SNF-related matrix-associated actin-dependent regulator of chromatin subfamily D [Nematocida sp. AWRm80]
MRSERLKSLFESLVQTEKRLEQAIKEKKMTVEEAHFKKIKGLSTIRLNILMERNSEGALFMLIGGKLKIESQAGPEESRETHLIGAAIKRLFVDMSTKDRTIEDSPEKVLLEKNNKEYEVPEPQAKRIKMQKEEESSFFEWNNQDNNPNIGEFEIKTHCISPHGKIFLGLTSYTGTYTVCEALAEHIGITAGSKPVILLAIWKYISAQKMKTITESSVIQCNPVFESLFKAKELTFREIIERLDEYLLPLEMITIPFEIPTEPNTKAQVAYDITVELEHLNREYAYSNEPKISILDKKIQDILIRLEKQQERIDSLDKFIKDPKQFITNWTLETSKSLHLVADDLYEVNDGFYTQKEIQESVYQLLQNYK